MDQIRWTEVRLPSKNNLIEKPDVPGDIFGRPKEAMTEAPLKS